MVVLLDVVFFCLFLGGIFNNGLLDVFLDKVEFVDKFEDLLRLVFFKKLLLLWILFNFILFVIGVLIGFDCGIMKFFRGVLIVFFNGFF